MVHGILLHERVDCTTAISSLSLSPAGGLLFVSSSSIRTRSAQMNIENVPHNDQQIPNVWIGRAEWIAPLQCTEFLHSHDGATITRSERRSSRLVQYSSSNQKKETPKSLSAKVERGSGWAFPIDSGHWSTRYCCTNYCPKDATRQQLWTCEWVASPSSYS